MKTVYIPKGETVSYESLVTERLVVEGCLKTAYGVKAKTISGKGVICAGTIAADSIRAGDLEADAVICKRLLAQRVEAPEVFASESAVVSCYLSAACVKAGKLTVSISDIDQVEADEVINLPPKKRSLFGTLLASVFRTFWARLTEPSSLVMDAEYTQEQADSSEQEEMAPQQEPAEAAVKAETAEPQNAPEPVDEELNRFIAMFKLTRDAGYTLRIVPGTPEDNAPVFDFENETIIRPAA